MEFKEGLIEKRDTLYKERAIIDSQIEAVNLLLKAEGHSGDYTLIEFNNPLVKIKTKPKQSSFFDIEHSSDFPKHARRDKQVLWLLENKLKRGVKLQDIQNKYNEIRGLDKIGDEIKITNVARRLNRDGKLGVVKYNGVNKNSFWGLSEWINENGFLEEYSPNDNLLPIDVEFVEVIIGKQKSPQ